MFTEGKAPFDATEWVPPALPLYYKSPRSVRGITRRGSEDLTEPNTNLNATAPKIASIRTPPNDTIVGKHSEEHYDTVVYYLFRIPLRIIFTPVYCVHVLLQFATVNTDTTADYLCGDGWRPQETNQKNMRKT